MKGRALVTGSDGFTGRYVCADLERDGWEVWRAGLGTSDIDTRYLRIDLLNTDTLSVINDLVLPDIVIHLAASSFVASESSIGFYETNLIGTKNLLEVLRRAKTPPRNTILASSATVCGYSASGAIREDHPTRPLNHYGVSKLAMEHLANIYMSEIGITITRPFNYTGVGQDDRFLIAKIVKHFRSREKVLELGNIDVCRDFSDVRDISKIYLALANLPPVNEAVNLCSGRGIEIRSILNMMREISGHEIRIQSSPDLIRPNEVKELWGGPEKLADLVGEKPVTPFKDTLLWMYTE